MAIKGKYAYNGLEVGNLSLGQNGFELVENNTAREGTFCAIKNVTDLDEGGNDGSSATDPIGWLSVTVDIGGPKPATSLTFALGAGDIVYGPFTKVTLSTGNDEKILIYYG